MKPICGPNGLPKGPAYSNRMYSDEPYAIILIHDQAVHAARRKNWNKVFSPKALKGYGSISTAVRDLMDQITEMSTLLSSTAEDSTSSPLRRSVVRTRQQRRQAPHRLEGTPVI